MANNKQQKKTEVKKTNPDEDSTGNVVTTSLSSTQAATSDVYEFVSTPKHSSCSSGDENPVKSFDKCSDNDKSETDSDTLMTSSNAVTLLNVQQQKRALGDQQDRSEDNLSPADDDSKRKKRKDSEFPPLSSAASTSSTISKEGKSSLPSGTNRVTSRVGQKPPGPASKTMGLIGKGSDKSPCESPKMSSTKSPADTSEVDNEDVTKSSADSNPKVPPLKIVIPQTQQTQTAAQSQSQVNSSEAQDQQKTSSSKAPRNISSSTSALPYVLNASSNSNDSNSNDKTETPVSSGAGRSQSPTESNKSANNEDGNVKQTTGGKSKEPRVLRSSQRGGKDSKDDRSSNNSSPQLPASSTPSPAAQNSGDSSSTGTESEVTSTAVTSSSQQNVPSQQTSTSSSSLLSQQQAQIPQQMSSVELHPRKRKIKVSSSSKDPQPLPSSSSTTTSSSTAVTSSSVVDTKDSNSKDGSEKAQGTESTHPHDQPYTNCYQMYIDLRKQIDQRHKNLHPIEPRPLKGLEDYLMNRRTYSLQGKTPMELNIAIPPLFPNQMKDTFCEQEKERHKLKMRHIVEKEKLVLSKEQEILRVHCKAAQMIANQAVSFSACTILKDEEVYNIITPEQEEKYRNKNRERSHGRVFYQALKELDDKWDRIKVKFNF